MASEPLREADRVPEGWRWKAQGKVGGKFVWVRFVKCSCFEEFIVVSIMWAVCRIWMVSLEPRLVLAEGSPRHFSASQLP